MASEPDQHGGQTTAIPPQPSQIAPGGGNAPRPQINITRDMTITSLVLLQRHGFQAGTFIDAGASEGRMFVERRRLNLFPGADHFFIDAQSEYEQLYQRVQAKFGGGYAITAIGSIQGQTQISIDATKYGTRISAGDLEQPQSPSEQTRVVPLTTLDALCAKHALRAPYVLYMDLQGNECDACRGGLAMLEKTAIVVAETQIFADKDNIADLMHLMFSRGFVLFDITELAHNPVDHSLYQCYLVFIPRRFDFRKRTALWPKNVEMDRRMMEHHEKILGELETLLRS